MKNRTLIILVVLLMSCKKEGSFDAAVWNSKDVDRQMTDFRERMVEDLIKSDTLTGLTKEQLFELLGKPEIENDHDLKYLVREKYEWNIDPEYITYLRIELKNGIATRSYLEITR